MVTRLLLASGLLAVVSGLAFLARARLASRASFEPPVRRVRSDLIPEDARDRWAILGFTAPLCGPCQNTPGIAEAAIEQAGLDEDDVTFVQADIRRHGKLVDVLELRETPTVLVLDPDGHIRFTHEGNPTAETLAEQLDAARDPDRGTAEVTTGLAASTSAAIAGGEPPW